MNAHLLWIFDKFNEGVCSGKLSIPRSSITAIAGRS